MVVVVGDTTVVVDPEVVVVGTKTVPVGASEEIAVVVRDDDNVVPRLRVVVEDKAVVVARNRGFGTAVGLNSDADIKDVVLAKKARL